MDRVADQDSDEEWEYEYDDTETEAFYLNLDLASHHGPMRPPRRRQDDNASANEVLSAAGEGPSTNASADAYTPLDSAETDAASSERIQILGLHTCNPVVSYHNQIFSCSWADQIGTELIFSHPETDPDTDALAPLQQGQSFDLLAANSVKILGRKANITSSSGPSVDQQGAVAATPGVSAETSSSLTTGSRGVPRRAVPPSYQADFIQRLQNVKAAKGETDTVRTVMSTRRNIHVAERLDAWARTEAQLAEINGLQRRAVDGDPQARETLGRMIREHVQPFEENGRPS